MNFTTVIGLLDIIGEFSNKFADVNDIHLALKLPKSWVIRF